MSLVKEIIAQVKQRDPDEPEFRQAVIEVMESLETTAEKHPEFVKAGIFRRIIEPDRTVIFRVTRVKYR